MQQDKFLDELTQLTKELGFHGNEKAPSTAADLSLEDILRLQVLMGSERARLSLELGADPNSVRKGMTLLKLAESLDDEKTVALLKEYGAKLRFKRHHQP